jgi:hypothetical protein
MASSSPACRLVQGRTEGGGARLCGISGDLVLTNCPISLTKCEFWEACTPSETHSFSFDGQVLEASVCSSSNKSSLYIVIGCAVAAIVALFLLLWFGLWKPMLDRARTGSARVAAVAKAAKG